MPILKNPRHELFCHARAAGKTADEAYQIAGFTENRGNATRLNANESIGFRIAELQAITAQNSEITVESLAREAADIQRLATAAGQFSAASGALVAKAKLAGLWVEKTDNVNRSSDPNMLPDERLADIVAAAAPPPEPTPVSSPNPSPHAPQIGVDRTRLQ